MSARVDPQTSLYEVTIENPELEAALEDREKLRQRAAKARSAYAEADEVAKGLAATLVDDAPVRVGRFVLTRRRVPPRSIAFETEGSTRLTIRPIAEAE